MNKIAFFLLTAACAVWSAFGYSWSGKTGTVTIENESAEVNESDKSVVAALTGIVLKGENAKIIFKNTSALTLTGTITGDGEIIKRGSGDVIFGTPHTTTRVSMGGIGSSYKDYYTKKGITIETGDLYFPQAGKSAAWYGPVTVAAGATLHIHPDSGTGVDALNGAGTVNNGNSWTWYHNPEATVGFHITNYGDTHESNFSGTFVGCFSITCSGVAQFTGTTSFASASFSSLRNSNASAIEDRGVSTVARFGQRPPISKRGTSGTDSYFNDFPGTFGVGNSYYYGSDFDINYGGVLVYGGSGETTDKKFRFGSSDYYGRTVVFDAGTKGGVTFSGSISQYGSAKTDGAILRGSNTSEMNVACDVSSTGGILAFKKQGTGTWRFSGTSRSGYAGAWHIEEGTLRYDTIANIGEDCALGVATNCYPFSTGKTLPAYWQSTAKLGYEIELGAEGKNPVFEYSGSDLSQTEDRRIGLLGTDVTISSGSRGGRVNLLGGVFSADGKDKTIHLTGAAETSTIGNISNGSGSGVVSVEKSGSGEWRLARDLHFTGSLTVNEGTLTVDPGIPQNYKWYRLTITKLGKVHAVGDMSDCAGASYYVRLRALALYTADGEPYSPTMKDRIPWSSMTAEQASGAKSYKYGVDYWRGLEPGEVTVGAYVGNEYRTYPGNTLQNIFTNMAKESGASMTVYNTYLGCTPTLSNTTAWLPIVFRLPDDAPAIAYYDLVADHTATQTSGHVATWQMEGSEDGVKWTKLHEITTCAHTKQNYWASTGDSILYTKDANCLTEGRGYKLSQTKDAMPATSWDTDLASVGTVAVAGGATLAAVSGAEVHLPSLKIDASAKNNAIIQNLIIAANGTLDLTGLPADATTLPVTFTGCSNLGNLANWTVRVNGVEKPGYKIAVKDDAIILERPVFLIIVK